MILLDTSFLVSYFNIRDENHLKAAHIMKSINKGVYGDIYLTDYIFDEFVTVIFIRLKNLIKTVKLGSELKESLQLELIDEETFEKSWFIFKNQKDTFLSFTDCSSLAIMQKNKIKNIATFDKDFEKVNDINVVSCQ